MIPFESSPRHRNMATRIVKSVHEGKKKMNFFVLNLFELVIEGVANNMRNDFELDANGEVRFVLRPLEGGQEEFQEMEDVIEPLVHDDLVQEEESLEMLPSNQEVFQSDGSSISSFSKTKDRKTERKSRYKRGRYICPFELCRQKFEVKSRWESHLCSHNRRPFACRYRGCSKHYKHRSTAIRHIREKHFKLPKTLREQRRRKIVDNRNPNYFVRIAFD